MTDDHIKIVLGMDTSPVARGLRTTWGSVKKWSADVRKSINESIGGAFKDAFRNFGALFSVAGAAALAKRIGDMADEVKGASEAFGVSTDFIQGWRTAVSQNSGTVEQANKGIERLSLLIGQNSELFAKWGLILTDSNGRAKTVEEVIGDIAELLKNTSSGSERAAIAFDLFGKSGAALIPTLNMGREALQNYIEAADKLSASGIRELADAQDTLNLAMNNFTIRAAKVVEWIMHINRTLKQAKSEFDPKRDGGFLGNWNAFIRSFGASGDKSQPTQSGVPSTVPNKAGGIQGQLDILSAMLSPIRQMLAMKEKAAKFSALETEYMREQVDLLNAKNRLSDLSKMTLEEVANSTGRNLSGDRAKAHHALNLREQAEQARLNGDSEGAARLMREADRVINGDSGALKNLADIRNAQAAETFERQGNKRMADFFRNRLPSEFSGINSLKSSEKVSPMEQAARDIAKVQKDLETIREKIEFVTKE